MLQKHIVLPRFQCVPSVGKNGETGFQPQKSHLRKPECFKGFFSGAGDNYDKGLLGAGWGPPQKRFVFLGPLNLISCNFSTIFSIFFFRQKRTFNGQGEGKTIQ